MGGLYCPIIYMYNETNAVEKVVKNGKEKFEKKKSRKKFIKYKISILSKIIKISVTH